MACSSCSGKRITGRSYNVSGMTRAERIKRLQENVKKQELKGYEITVSANASKKSERGRK